MSQYTTPKEPAVYLRDTDVAKRYNVSRKTVWRWTQDGHLPKPVRLGPSTVRWLQADLERFEAERGAA
jgi:prophage regulatory protein